MLISRCKLRYTAVLKRQILTNSGYYSAGFTLTLANRCFALPAHATSLRTDDEEATMSLQFPDMHTIWTWIFHVPDTYEMLWWVLLCVCWFGFVIERRVKIIQQHLADAATKDAKGR